MASRKRTPVATRHGATQPESERKAKAVMLRLPLDVAKELDEVAALWGLTRSATVVRLVLYGQDSAVPDDYLDRLESQLRRRAGA